MSEIIENKLNLSEAIVYGMQEKKAQDIVVMDLKDLQAAVADCFIICSANSDTQVESISESIEKEVFRFTNLHPWRSEGKKNKEWILLDYVSVVAHIFKKDKREFYALEELWGDAKVINIEND